MVTKQEAMTCGEFFCITHRKRNGGIFRYRASGKCKTWKTRPDHFRLPVKYGIYQSCYITHENAHEWSVIDPTDLSVKQKDLADIRSTW